jgi:nicotinate phosphoribosyltransferase
MKSFLDDDFYNFTMQNAILTQYPNAVAEYKFTCRSKNKFNSEFMFALQDSIYSFKDVKISEEEIQFLDDLNLFPCYYLDYLRNYRFDPKEVNLGMDDSNLNIRIFGNWAKTVLWEVRLLYSISDIYFKTIDTNWSLNQQEIENKIANKVRILEDNGCKFIEFGTRRRRSSLVQEYINNVVSKNPMCLGTSNVYYSFLNNRKPIGTMAHQWIMGISGLETLLHANRAALYSWDNVYNGKLGIALPDTFGTKIFREDFDSNLSRIYDGVRHDSGCPITFANEMVVHYKSLNICPTTKTIVFSDSLNPEKAVKIKKHCDNIGIKCVFGIGTNFTNDFEDSPALNIVIKLDSIAKDANSRQIKVVKISDEPNKATGDKDALRVARWTFFGESLD